MSTPTTSSLRPGRLSLAGGEEHHHHHQPHFLESCYLCRKPLGSNADIFMYRGNTPFCSNECRQEQIEIDEAKENSWKLASSLRRSVRKSADSKKSAPNKAIQTGTVEVA